ncbi:hypothetical protein OHR68_31630 [Spirillospora sp. NBC_00431]
MLISSGLCATATSALRAGRLRDANRITRERLALLPSMDRDDPHCAPEICNAYGRACIYAIMAGDLPGGMAAARASMDDDLLSDTHITANRLIQPLALTGRFRDAIRYAERMWDQWERAGRPAPGWTLPGVCTTVLASGMLGEPESVALWRSRAGEVAGGASGPAVGPAAGGAAGTAAVVVFVDARLAVHDRRFDDAEALVRQCFAVDGPLDPYVAYARAAGAELAVAAGLPGAADLVASAAPLAEENAWAAACLARARWRLHGDRAELARAAEGWERLDARAERDCTRALAARPG